MLAAIGKLKKKKKLFSLVEVSKKNKKKIIAAFAYKCINKNIRLYATRRDLFCFILNKFYFFLNPDLIYQQKLANDVKITLLEIKYLVRMAIDEYKSDSNNIVLPKLLLHF